MEEIKYKLDVFEGPLDLLLHLIEINKVDIYDIPIAEITDQYLAYISEMDFYDMDLASDFLVMASQLLRIKSEMLLPKKETDEEETDPRADLVQRLIEYKKYRYLAGKLAGRGKIAERYCFKGTTIPDDLEYVPEPPDLDELTAGIDGSDLQRIFQDVMRRSFNKIDPIRSKFGKIRKEPVDYTEKSKQVRSYIRKKRRNISFRKMLTDNTSKEEVIVTFLVILEMMKDGSIQTRQEKLFDDIVINVRDTEENREAEKEK